MDAFRIVATGNSEVAVTLRHLGGAFTGRQMQTALIAGALIVQNDAKRRAPYRTGTLRRSIHILEQSPREVRVGTNVPYARRIEFGFSGRDSLGRFYNQAPRPYLRPAMDTNRGAVIRAVADVLRIQLRAAA